MTFPLVTYYDKKCAKSAKSLLLECRPAGLFLDHGCFVEMCEKSELSELSPVGGGVVFSKLSKLLNREDALSAPWSTR